MERYYFVFSDSLEVGGILSAGFCEGFITEYRTAADLVALLPNMFFARIACVAD